MVDRSANTVLALKLETVPGTFVAPNNTTDLITVADLKPNIAGLTSEVTEFTGSIHKEGPKVGGATFEISGRVLLRGPGGVSLPAADTFVLGRILRAVGFAETLIATAIPPAPEAVGAGGDNNTIQLGATAAATADLYTGLAVFQSLLGTIPSLPALAMIKKYFASKNADIGQTHTAPLTSGNYQIPTQLAYVLSAAEPPSLSASCWIGSKRYDGVGLSISSFKINAPTFSRESTDFPSIEFTLTGDLQADADDTAPIPNTSQAVPPFKNGKLWIANTKLGGTSLDVDFGATVAYAPNPNKVTGNEAAVLVETTRRANLTLNHVSKATFDFIGLADAQAYHSIMATWGLGTGNSVGLIVPEARFNYFSPDNGGPLVNAAGEMLVDGAAKSVSLVFPYY